MPMVDKYLSAMPICGWFQVAVPSTTCHIEQVYLSNTTQGAVPTLRPLISSFHYVQTGRFSVHFGLLTGFVFERDILNILSILI
jgi:hypothetical protein